MLFGEIPLKLHESGASGRCIWPGKTSSVDKDTDIPRLTSIFRHYTLLCEFNTSYIHIRMNNQIHHVEKSCRRYRENAVSHYSMRLRSVPELVLSSSGPGAAESRKTIKPPCKVPSPTACWSSSLLPRKVGMSAVCEVLVDTHRAIRISERDQTKSQRRQGD